MDIQYVFIPLITYVFTQSVKVIFIYKSNKKLTISDAFRSGGMPSVHSATSMSLAFAFLKDFGMYHPYFVISALLSAIVIYDAVGVRYAVSRHAMEINNIKSFLLTKNSNEFKVIHKMELSEYIGHTIPEAIVGATIGALFGWFLS